MNDTPRNPDAPSPPDGEYGACAAPVASIVSQFEVILGNPDQVGADCERLRAALAKAPLDGAPLAPLLPLLRRRSGDIAARLFGLLADLAPRFADPWPVVEALLEARDRELAVRALDLAVRLAASGALVVDSRLVGFLATKVEIPECGFAEPEPMHRIARLLARRARSPGETHADPVQALFLDPGTDAAVRRLAARVLDQTGEPASQQAAERLLGRPAARFLAPDLAYTRASHLDLAHLAVRPGRAPPVLASLRRARRRCGEKLLRQVIARLGWSRLNFGLEVRRCVAVGVPGSLPFVVDPAAAGLLARCPGMRRERERILCIARGGPPGATPRAGDADPIARFRATNVLHAEVLRDFLDVAPLTRAKVERLLRGMDTLVAEFTALFAAASDECAILPDVYGDLRGRIVAELVAAGALPQASAELTRLVQAFEDPGNLGEVRTLHGLKRYLHQSGLRLGSRLVSPGSAPNRTVDLVLGGGERVLAEVRCIRYADFEPQSPADGPRAAAMPAAVALLAEAFARQLLHGQSSFPRADVFCFGNEVHYYLAFLKHPVFLRIDTAPPLSGGMIDLEYYGVSKYEVESHPDLGLGAVRAFLRGLEFDVEIDDTRVHARYDKERAHDLGDLHDQAATILRLVPYLMDLDWGIAALERPEEERRTTLEEWLAVFRAWGVLPLHGVGHAHLPPASALDGLRARLEELDLGGFWEGADAAICGQLDLERRLLEPLRRGVVRGELRSTRDGYRRVPPDLFGREDAAERFALLLAEDERLQASVHLARLAVALERSVGFTTTGRVETWPVQEARVPLGVETVGLFVLRDPSGIIRLAEFSRDPVLHRVRRRASHAWRPSGSVDARALAALLRASGYSITAVQPASEDVALEAERLRADLRRPQPPAPASPLPGERVLCGVGAAPGWAVGTALLGTTARLPEDFAGAVLVAPTVRPDDGPYLFHASGVVSTGGGILSHAGLLAAQFGKPSLIVSGTWQQEPSGTLALRYCTTEYEEEERVVGGWRVATRRNVRERGHVLREGDVVVLDAAHGTLRVLGHERDVLALHEGFGQLERASRALAHPRGEREVLVLRGQRLRARHQIERVLVRMSDEALARHAVLQLLAPGAGSGSETARDERARLLALVLGNPLVGQAARDHLERCVGSLAARFRARTERAVERLPRSSFVHEVVLLRHDLRRLQRALEGALAALRSCGMTGVAAEPAVDGEPIDALCYRRLEALGDALSADCRSSEAEAATRHRLAGLGRIAALLGDADADRALHGAARARLAAGDDRVRTQVAGRRILFATDGGIELAPYVGWKAANLAEVDRLAGPGHVPPWFAITDRAFREVLDAALERHALAEAELPAEARTLGAAIECIQRRPERTPAQKSVQIRALWRRSALPPDLVSEISAAYRQLAGPGDAEAGAFVAIRSSAREEDVETAARAGEFETSLFVRGEAAVLEHLKRTWSGLWTERAMRSRTALGVAAAAAGGGVLVQRMIPATAAGVLQTIGVASGELGEMVLDVGLGLGEGVVSGTVGVDQIHVSKDGDLASGALRFRYATGEKREQVVFDRRAGHGTVRVETLYHQRLRPALEYSELCQLVAVAARLEAAYGYPLDIEFALEASRLWILQVRPVNLFFAALADTLERDPLPPAARLAALVGDVRGGDRSRRETTP